MTTAIDILLATFNGADYLQEQLDSLFAQTYQDWRLIVRDDGSTDATREILARYVDKYPERITLLAQDPDRLGPARSFARLLDQSSAAYTMFCDQDDAWMPDKIEVTLAAMRDLERSHGQSTPLLVSTDLKVVDARLGVLGESFWRLSRIHPERLNDLGGALVQNFATGCTTMINRRLADLARPLPGEVLMHDWWLALVATAFGKRAALPRATVLYRQHGRNVAGVSQWSFLTGVNNYFFHRDRRRAARSRGDALWAQLRGQAAAFAAHYGHELSPRQKGVLDAFCRLTEQGLFRRRLSMVRYGFLPSDRWQSFLMLVLP